MVVFAVKVQNDVVWYKHIEKSNKWYFVTKYVLNYWEKKKCSSDKEKNLKFQADNWKKSTNYIDKYLWPKLWFKDIKDEIVCKVNHTEPLGMGTHFNITNHKKRYFKLNQKYSNNVVIKLKKEACSILWT